MHRKWTVYLLATGVVVSGAMWAQQRRRFEPPVLQSTRGLRGGIAGGTTHGTEAGMRMYHLGGNAVDAGVAAVFAGAVAEYSHFGFGGEAPILIRTKAGKVFAIAGVGTMPKSATADFFRARKLLQGEFFPDAIERNGLKGMVPVAGVMPALVPGMPEAAMVALREFGTRSLAEAIQPAIELADGMPLDETRASTIARSKKFFDMWPASRRYFMPEGRTQFEGEIFRQPELASTMRRMAEVEKHARAAVKRVNRRSMPCATSSIAARSHTRSRTSSSRATASSSTKIWPPSGSNRKKQPRPRIAATKCTSPASGVRAR
jgi:gamma-glutamyltranspeptidase/glutathione hydrolase